MRFPVTTALRAELERARGSILKGQLALFVLGLSDEGDLPAWELAAALAPDRIHPGSAFTMLIGAAPVGDLARTLQSAGERELSAALRSSVKQCVPVVLVEDDVRIVKTLEELEDEEAESLIYEHPVGHA